MKTRIDDCQKLILQTDPLSLEGMIRGLLIQYFFHISDKNAVEIVNSNPFAPKVITCVTPTVFKGKGVMRIASSAVFGVAQSPSSYACSYVEARTETSRIEVGEGTYINNRATIVSEGAGIKIGHRCLIGPEFVVLDANGHELEVSRRSLPDQNPQPVEIGDDVFIGIRVTILKGCRIGSGSVIAAGSVLQPYFEAPPFSTVAGNPARIVGSVLKDNPSGPADQ